MRYYQLNRDKLLKEAKNRYHNGGGKEKAAEYNRNTQEFLGKTQETGRGLSEEEKKVKGAYKRDRVQKYDKG